MTNETTINESMPFGALTIGQARQMIDGLIAERLKPLSKPEAPKPDIMGIDEALQFLSENGCFISKNAVYNLTATGRIPCRKFGKRLNFSRKELSAWVDSNTTRKDSGDEALTIAESARRKR